MNERTEDEQFRAEFWAKNEEAARKYMGPSNWPAPVVTVDTSAIVAGRSEGFEIVAALEHTFTQVRALGPAREETPDDRIRRDWSAE